MLFNFLKGTFWGEVHWNYLWLTGQTSSLILGYYVLPYAYMLCSGPFFFNLCKLICLYAYSRIQRQEEMHIKLLCKLVLLTWIIFTWQLRFFPILLGPYPLWFWTNLGDYWFKRGLSVSFPLFYPKFYGIKWWPIIKSGNPSPPLWTNQGGDNPIPPSLSNQSTHLCFAKLQ